jgi:phosphatidylglycerol---prolipoprotein diacylglyceryl transferase
MKPTLFAGRFAGVDLTVPTYGVMVTLGFFLAIVLVYRQGTREKGLPGDGLLDLCWWLLVTGILGSRLFYVLLNVGDYVALCRDGGPAGCLAPLRIWDGGLVFYGGALAAGATTVWIARRHGWSIPIVADLFAPALVLGHAVGRLGCFAAGCCYGKLCVGGGAGCVRFPPGSVAHMQLAASGGLADASAATPPLFPTQLMESAVLFALFAFLLWFRRRARFPGQVVLVYLVGYASLRFVLEIFRGDAARRFLFEIPAADPMFLSTSQAVSLVLIVVGAIVLRRRARAAGST